MKEFLFCGGNKKGGGALNGTIYRSKLFLHSCHGLTKNCEAAAYNLQ